jgi:hypothetical protein
MEGLLSEFAAPSLTRKTQLPRWDIFIYPSQRHAHGTSVDIKNSVALRATPVKAQRGQCVFRSGDAAEEFQELGRADNGVGDAEASISFSGATLARKEIAIVGRPVGSDDG